MLTLEIMGADDQIEVAQASLIAERLLRDGWAQARSAEVIDGDPSPIAKVKFWIVYTKNGHNPKVTYNHFRAALREAVRLSKKHPDQSFFVMEAKRRARTETETDG